VFVEIHMNERIIVISAMTIENGIRWLQAVGVATRNEAVGTTL
jgi:hypothetical protein